ncbi:MAG: hypothetical protein WCA10_03890 [Terracidiphilus sp.]
MSGAIKGAFAHDGKLFLRSESGLYTVQDNGKEPRDWTSEQFSGANEGLEAFQAFYFDEVHEMVNITNIHGQDRQDLTDAIMVMVLEGLLPAFDELRSIRLYKDKLLPVLNRKKHYENLARVLWHGYKDLWPKVAGLLGYNIGFVFQREANFNQGLEAFVAQNQSQLLLDVREFLTRQRTNWQQHLATFRNDFLEHRNAEVAATVDRFYDPKWADAVFIAVWRTIAELLSTFLESRFMPNVSIARAEQRLVPGRPRMWQTFLCDPAERQPFTKIIV